jgi:hypothetical protein
MTKPTLSKPSGKPPVSLKKYLAVKAKAMTTLKGKTMDAKEGKAIRDAREELRVLRVKLSKAGFGKTVVKTITVNGKKQSQVTGIGITKALRAWKQPRL